MKNIVEFINESSFNNEMLESLLVLIAGKFNKGTNGAENLVSDRFGTHTDYTFNVGLSVTGSENIYIDDSEIIKRSIGHIVEGTIKGALAGNFSIHIGNGFAGMNFSLKPHQNFNDNYDFEIIDNDGNWGSAKFEIKAVKSAGNNNEDLRKMKNNVSISDAEKSACDFFLIVEYILDRHTVHIPAMHIFNTSFAPINHKIDDNGNRVGKTNKSHLTKTQLDNAIHYVGNNYN